MNRDRLILLLLSILLFIPFLGSVQFFEEHQDEKAYFETFKYKSYANYFYGRVNPNTNTAQTAEVHYIVCKVQHIPHLLEKNMNLDHLCDKGGFSFYRKTH